MRYSGDLTTLTIFNKIHTFMSQLSFKTGIERFSPGRRKLSSNSNKEPPSPTIAIAVYIDKANPMP
jgi:hypothetical protein